MKNRHPISIDVNEESSKINRRHRSGASPYFIPGKKIRIFPKYEEDWSKKEIVDDMIDGYIPSSKSNRSSKVFTIGSCFANNVSNLLQKNGIETFPFTMSSEFQNVFSLEQFFTWVETGKISQWHDKTGKRVNIEESNNTTREEFLNYIKECEIFIVTLGLSEIWRDKITNHIFWRAVPQKIWDESRHHFTIATVDETEKSIDNIISIIKRITNGNKNIKIVFTLSPVPLKATFTEKSCIVANSASKAIIRVALNNLVMKKTDQFFYWPSYEIVTELGMHSKCMSFTNFENGIYDNYHRHVNSKFVNIAINKFLESYFY